MMKTGHVWHLLHGYTNILNAHAYRSSKPVKAWQNFAAFGLSKIKSFKKAYVLIRKRFVGIICLQTKDLCTVIQLMHLCSLFRLQL